MPKLIIKSLVITVSFYSIASSTVINVPADYPTIQAGINAAVNGDTVLVAPGTYSENVQMAEGVSLIGSGMENTIIDGGGAGDVVEAPGIRNFLIEKFTVQNSRQDGNTPGNVGIFMNTSSSSGIKTIRYCHVRQNGMGIAVWNDFGALTYVENSIIEGNIYDGFSPYLGMTYLTNNVIMDNGRDGYHDWSGGGSVYIKNNIFAENGRYGIFKHRDTPVFISYNDVWNNVQGAYYQGYSGPPTPFDPTPGTGEIALDPLFRDPDNGDFHLCEDSCGYIVDSPCIDAGDPGISDNLLGCDWGLEYPASDMGIYGGDNGGYQTGVDENDITLLPESIFNLDNYPNPFNSATVISFVLPYESHVKLTIYDILGRRVETLANQVLPPGHHRIHWKPSGSGSGIYFYSLEAYGVAEVGKMFLLR